MERLDQLAVTKLRAVCRKHITISNQASRSRALLYSAIESMPSVISEAIVKDALEEIAQGRTKYRRSNDDNPKPSKKRRIVDVPTEETPVEQMEYYNVTDQQIETIISSDFLHPPDDGTLNLCLQKYIDATNDQCLRRRTCGSCARERFPTDSQIVSVHNLPHKELLAPHKPHPAHQLFHDMLLHPASIFETEETMVICNDCFHSLKSEQRPKFSLGNNMWVGDIPPPLVDLTLPERMLIAKYYPAAYIVKLYPKQRGSRTWNQSQMHNGLRGNVSTYKLDPHQVAALIDGTHTVYPPNPKILSATIGITFVGPKGLKEASMPNMFRVRRWKVREALQWLQQNNPLYADIVISEPNLNALPDDGIPDELLLTAKYSNNIDKLNEEHSGYVPEDAIDEEQGPLQTILEDAGLMEANDDPENGESYSSEPEIIPLQALGVVDIEGEDITTSEMLAHALSNVSLPPIPEDFTIRRGSAFINEYARVDPKTGQRNDGGPSNPNHLLGSFPTLFPYGRGGFETDRPVEVTYEAHARWAMEYCDRRFRKDLQFPFQIFGVMQKREVCRSSCLQMKKSSYSRNIGLISTLRPEDFIKASKEETQGVRFSNPAIRALREELSAVRTKVKGTDESRFSVHSKVWGTNLIFNPPSIWLTINPADTQDPIAQLFAGADINLDAFCATEGPDHLQRGINIASDPFASAQYFHFIVKTVFEELFGIQKLSNGRFSREYGVLGKVQAYIGTVEAQGRGTLHLHTLIWLKDAPTSQQIKKALDSEAFRTKMRNYISKVIQADIDGKGSADVTAIPKVKGVSYSRPPDPRSTTIEERSVQLGQLVRALQYHQCTAAACLKIVNGRLQCKRRAPFALAENDWVDEEGNWGPKRLCEWINSFNPTIMHSIKANHDLKLVLSGRDTATITFYITNYATKKQQRTSNVSALLANTVAFHRQKEKRQVDFNLVNKRLIERCANSLTRYREFSAPEVMSYIMGWGDVYESHHYVAIYWDHVIRALKNFFPELKSPASNRSSPVAQSSDSSTQTSNENLILTEPEGSQSESVLLGTDDANLEVTGTIALVDGTFILKDQLRDYQYRGEELADMSLFDFLLSTYEGEAPKGQEDNDTQNAPQRGRPLNPRVKYKRAAKKPGRIRIIRTPGHETLPRFVGSWFPRNNGETLVEKEFYSASMLALLKPWTSLHDLKGEHSSFHDAFDAMVSHSNKRINTVILNIQYYYECLDGAKARRQAEKALEASGQNSGTGIIDPDILKEMLQEAEHNLNEYTVAEDDISEEDIQRERYNQMTSAERVFGSTAVIGGYDAGFFSDPPVNPEWSPVSRTAGEQDVLNIKIWEKQLKETTRRMAKEDLSFDQLSTSIAPTIVATDSRKSTPSSREIPATLSPVTGEQHQDNNPSSTRPKLALLNEAQKRAHDIIEKCLKHYLESGTSEQLRMLILGPGGTGKSMLIGAITETFAFYDKEDILAKCATTGIAASEIEGRTIHSWAGLSSHMSQSDDWLEKAGGLTTKKRTINIEGKEFVIIDEISMSDKAQFYYISEIVGKSRAKEFKGNSDEPFGGMNMILSGDFHQFPPVGNAPGALYVESSPDDSLRSQLGRNLFKQFDTVVILEEQIRVKDPVWMKILDKLRVGECDEEDIGEIRKLVLTNPECDIPDFSKPPWNQAILVTSRHGVRKQWNAEAVSKHCNSTGHIKYISPSEDVAKNTGQTPSPRTRHKLASMNDKQTGKLSDEVHIAIGMKAMVLMNLATEADIANGTRGTIADILLDSREAELNPEGMQCDNGVVKLNYPPAMILFKPDKPTKLAFPGIPPGLIPITPSEAMFTVKRSDGKTVRIRRRQYAMTPGYAFTDYKSQGQTIEYVLIDLGKPPGKPLSAFGVYVALSRSRGRDTIRLLRDFDKNLFQHHPSKPLRQEMKRINVLNQITKEKYVHGQS